MKETIPIETVVIVIEIIAGVAAVTAAASFGRHSLGKPLSLSKSEKGFTVDVNGWSALLLLGFVLILAPLYHFHDQRNARLKSVMDGLQECRNDLPAKIRGIDEFAVHLHPVIVSKDPSIPAPDANSLVYYIMLRKSADTEQGVFPAKCQRSSPVSIAIAGLHVSDEPQVQLVGMDRIGRYWTSREGPADTYEVTLTFDKSLRGHLISLPSGSLPSVN